MAYSLPFTNYYQFDQRLVPDFGLNTQWRVKQLSQGRVPPRPVDAAFDGLASAELLEKLIHGDQTTRRRSAEALAKRGEASEQVLPALMEMLFTYGHPNMQAHLLEV